MVVGPGVPLTDAQWARIEPLLPDRTPKRGGRWRDHRKLIDAIAYKFQTGTPWVSCGLTSTQPGPEKGAPAGEPDDHAIGRSRGGRIARSGITFADAVSAR